MANRAFFVAETERWVKVFPVARRNATPTRNTTMTTHTNTNGTTYYSTTDDDGQAIYSFTEDFQDIWTQEDQDAIEAGSTPAKF